MINTTESHTNALQTSVTPTLSSDAITYDTDPQKLCPVIEKPQISTKMMRVGKLDLPFPDCSIDHGGDPF